MKLITRAFWSGMSLLVCTALVWTAASAADPDAKLLPEGPGKDAVVKVCTECHGPASFRKARKTEEEWSETAQDMVERGAKALPAELTAVVTYLAQNFGPDSKVNMNTAPLEELKAVLRLTVPEAQAVIRYRQDNGSFKEWRDLLKVAGLDAAKVEAQKDRMGF
jgi:competence protein ComEA